MTNQMINIIASFAFKEKKSIILQRIYNQDFKDQYAQDVAHQYIDRTPMFQKNYYLLSTLKVLTAIILISYFYLLAISNIQIQQNKLNSSMNSFDSLVIKDNQEDYNKFSLQYSKNLKIRDVLSRYKYYDIQYFNKDISKNSFKIFQQNQIAQQKNRPLINLRKSIFGQFTQKNSRRIQQIKNNQQFKEIFQNINVKKINKVFVSYQLSSNPTNPNYLRAQFNRLNKKYNISSYGSQLPLCIVLVGRDKVKQTIQKSYESIRRQNYTNYKVVHIDDNSNDFTINKTIQYLNKYPQLKEKVTLIANNYQRNKLYSRNLGVTKFCNNREIIVDLDVGDWFIGNQVFQLINTVYQRGNSIKNQKHQVWMAYFQSIGYKQGCCPYITQKYHSQDFMKERKNLPVIKHLRTYTWKLYNKIDKSQMIDPLIPNKHQFYVQRQDAFMQYGMIQMSRPNNIVFLQQFVYFMVQNQNEYNVQKQYAQLVAETMKSYNRIQSLTQTPARTVSDQLKNHQLFAKRNQIESDLKIKLSSFKHEILNKYKEQRNKVRNIQIRKVYNSQSENKSLGQQSHFHYDVSGIEFQNLIPNFQYKKYGIQTSIQVGSIYDYMNLHKIIDMKSLKFNLANNLAHQVLLFQKNKKLQENRGLIQYQHFSSEKDIQQYLKTAFTLTPQNQKIKNDFEYHLGSGLSNQIVDRKYLELQYYYGNKKYNISSSKQENSFCIYSSGYNIYSKGSYILYFKSIQNLNYTNYHIVYVDDYSDDQSAYQIYKYLSQGQSKIKNKIKIIKNLQHIGILANIHIHIEKYCNPDDIIIIIDDDDRIIGAQTLHILNKKYLNPETWVIYSKFLIKSEHANAFYKSISSYPISVNLPQYRTELKYWVTSHLRTFRYNVQSLIPLTHFVEFKYDKQKEIVFPHYYPSFADRCQVYSYLQLSGRQRIHFLTEYLYLDQKSEPEKCHLSKQLYQEYKCRLKFPLRQVKNQNQQIEFDNRFNISQQLLNRLYEQYQRSKITSDDHLKN